MNTAITTTETRPHTTVSALSDRELLAQTRNLARVERHLQGAIIDHLAEIDARSLFLRRGYSSLFDYAVRELGYSDAAAARRIGAMRLCAEQPRACERLRDGSLSLSAAADLQWAFDRQRRRAPAVAPAPAGARAPLEPPPLVLDEAGRRQLVDDAAGKSTRQVRQMLADLDPELAPPADRVRPLGNGRYELKAVIDADTQQGLEQLKGLLSHVDPRMSVGQLVGRLVREALDRHDPSRPPRRARTGKRPAEENPDATRTAAAKERAGRQRGGTAARPKGGAARRLRAEARGPVDAGRPHRARCGAGFRSPRRSDAGAGNAARRGTPHHSGGEVEQVTTCHRGRDQARGLAARRGTVPLRRSGDRTTLYLTASAADRPRSRVCARRQHRSGELAPSVRSASPAATRTRATCRVSAGSRALKKEPSGPCEGALTSRAAVLGGRPA